MLVFQPADGAFGDLLSSEIRSDASKRYSSLSMLVAYAKHSGVARLAPALADFKNAGGTIRATVGLDQRHTTIEALELLQELEVAVSVFFDENASRTFHPKIYLLERGSKNTWIAAGSNNLTAGGLYLNYEASTILTGKAARDAAQNAGLKDALEGKTSHLKPLDAALFQSLIDQGYILPEKRAQEIRKANASSAATKAVFPRTKALPVLPVVDNKYKLKATKKPVPAAAPIIVTPPVAPPAVVPPAGAVIGASSGFWKRLTTSDVSTTSSPGQMIIPLEYLPLLPALGATVVKPNGAEQADVFFDAVYTNDVLPPVSIANARLVKYVPAPTHPRSNIDLRFTFRNRPLLNGLRAGDVLEFRHVGTPISSIEVRRVPAAKATVAGHYGLIP